MKRKSLISFAALLLQCQALPPLAVHQLVEVEPGGEVVLKLHGIDFEGDSVSPSIWQEMDDLKPSYRYSNSPSLFLFLFRLRLS